MMPRFDDEKTDPVLIDRVKNRDDSSAWRRFDATYRPMIRAWGRRLVGGGDEAEELGQIVMCEVARQIRTGKFRYEPNRSFRGWLVSIVRTRALNLLNHRQRRAEQPLPEPDLLAGPTPPDSVNDLIPTEADAHRLQMSLDIQRAVRARIASETWRAFWMVRVEGQPVAEVAAKLGKTYMATYRNQKRVAQMLKEETKRRQEEAQRRPDAEPGESNGA